MPGIYQYPIATSLEADDLFVIYRPTSGTMQISYQDMTFGGGRYDIAFGLSGDVPESNNGLFIFNAVDSFYIPQNFIGSIFTLDNPPAGDIVFGVYRNSTQVGTISFASGSGTGVGASDADVAFSAGLQLRIETPSGTAGAASPAFTFKAVPTAVGA